PFEKSVIGVAPPLPRVTLVLKRMSHGMPKMPVALKWFGSEPGTGCRAYAAADGRSRLNRSFPFCSDFAWVYVKRAPQRVWRVYGRSRVMLSPSYQKLLPTGSLMMTAL